MTPVERGERAKQLLEDEVLKECFRDIREQMVARLEQSGFADTDKQHEIVLLLQCLNQLKLQLSTYMQEIAVNEHKLRNEAYMATVGKRIRA